MINRGRQTHGWLAAALAILLALPPGALAQAPPPTAQTPAAPATIFSLKVIPLAGDKEMNELERRVMAPLVVEVRDQNDQTVEGADVTFRFPLDGPSARFQDRNNAKTFRTNADGQAAAVGWLANGQAGTFVVQVTATRGAEQGSAAISMTNVTRISDTAKSRKRGGGMPRWVKIAIVAGAAGAVVGIILAVHGSGSSSPTVITATPGSPTLGGPH